MAKARILIVDDNLTICKLLSTRLSSNGYTTTIANNGTDGLQKACIERPDLILLDITMPDMDGVEVGIKLRANPDTQKIPIIMLTARGERNIINLTQDRLKPEGYIVKPFNPERLLEEISQVLQTKKG